MPHHMHQDGFLGAAVGRQYPKAEAKAAAPAPTPDPVEATERSESTPASQ